MQVSDNIELLSSGGGEVCSSGGAGGGGGGGGGDSTMASEVSTATPKTSKAKVNPLLHRSTDSHSLLSLAAAREGVAPPLAFTKDAAQKVTISWENLTFEVPARTRLCPPLSKAPATRLVDGSSGSFCSGELTALMGPSGAGKSTLMNALAGRAPYGRFTEGRILYNTLEADPADYRRHLAYVMQHDALFPTQTPREALEFTAALRLGLCTPEERARRVQAAIEALRLERCADTMVGSALVPGLSGGEKKRTAVAVELLAGPSFILLDEPTSGLDSQTALELVQILKGLARSGCAVVCTIHQPSSEVFSLFDKVVMLWRGRVVYSGAGGGVCERFDPHGVLSTVGANPADVAMLCLQTFSELEMEEVAERQDPETRRRCTGRLERLDLDKLGTSGVCAQFGCLAKREFQAGYRDTATLGSRLGMAFGLALLVGLIFFRVADEWGEDGNAVDIVTKTQNHFGAVSFACINAMFSTAQPMVLAFPLERPAFLREYTSGLYGVVPYLLAKTLFDFILTFAQHLVSTGLLYPLLGLSGDFMLLTCCFASISLVSASVALVVSCATTSVEAAVNALPGLYIPQIMFGGVFVASNQIPKVLRWVQWGTPLKHGVGLVVLAEFAPGVVPDDREGYVAQLLDKIETVPGDWHVYLLVSVAMYVGLRVVSACVLWHRARTFG